MIKNSKELLISRMKKLNPEFNEKIFENFNEALGGGGFFEKIHKVLLEYDVFFMPKPDGSGFIFKHINDENEMEYKKWTDIFIHDWYDAKSKLEV